VIFLNFLNQIEHSWGISLKTSESVVFESAMADVIGELGHSFM
jgi:hypothetical protein